MHRFADLPEWARLLLREARVGRLATAVPEEHPLVVPCCYALDEDRDRLYFAVDAKPKSGRKLRRIRHLEAEPRVTLLVDRWDEDWQRLAWVLVEAEARVVEGAARAQGIERLGAKYEQYRRMDLARAAGPVVELAVERLLSWRPTP